MHGRSKATEAAKPEAEKNALKLKMQKYTAAKQLLLDWRKSHPYLSKTQSINQLDAPSNDQSIIYANQLTSKLLPINPDFYTAWNMRKQMLNNKIKLDSSNRLSLCEAELRLIDQCLLQQPKSYCAWNHRVWVLDQSNDEVNSGANADLMQSELKLCDKMLKMDARNFHCWNYRQEVARRAHAADEDELKFCTDKTSESFSNYSAWHYRTILLTRLINQSQDQSNNWDRLQNEFDVINTTVWTEPNDQSIWLYHRWLIAQCQSIHKTIQSNDQPSSQAVALSPSLDEVLTREITRCRDLLEEEPECKWAILSLAMMLATHQSDSESNQESNQERAQLFAQLRSIDPQRAQYYTHMQQSLTTQ